MISALQKGAQRGFEVLVEKGPRHTINWFRYHFYERYREWSLGIETAGYGGWGRASEDSPDNNVYEPICYDCLDRALALLKIEPGKEILLDYGSGKGRIVTVAATHPFREVIGVELLPELVEIARDNVRRAYGKLKCKKINIIATDVTTFSVPADVSVFFFFNPFTGEIMKAAQQHIRRSLEQYPRKIRIVYMNPLSEPDPFQDCSWLEKSEEISPGWWQGMRFVIYSNNND